MAKNKSADTPALMGIDLAAAIRGDTKESTVMQTKQNQEPKPDWQYFSVVCSKRIVDKVKALAAKEGFSIRQVVEYMLNAGLAAYEQKHGVLVKDKRDIAQLFG